MTTALDNKPKILQEAVSSLEKLLKRLEENAKVVVSSEYDDYVDRLSYDIKRTLNHLNENQNAFHRIILADDPE
jgi:16S rRNA G1207 methylase RsmC